MRPVTTRETARPARLCIARAAHPRWVSVASDGRADRAEVLAGRRRAVIGEVAAQPGPWKVSARVCEPAGAWSRTRRAVPRRVTRQEGFLAYGHTSANPLLEPPNSGVRGGDRPEHDRGDAGHLDETARGTDSQRTGPARRACADLHSHLRSARRRGRVGPGSDRGRKANRPQASARANG
jgi:hypothetical protein